MCCLGSLVDNVKLFFKLLSQRKNDRFKFWILFELILLLVFNETFERNPERIPLIGTAQFVEITGRFCAKKSLHRPRAPEDAVWSELRPLKHRLASSFI